MIPGLIDHVVERLIDGGTISDRWRAIDAVGAVADWLDARSRDRGVGMLGRIALRVASKALHAEVRRATAR